jgi:hypothetical protein
VDSAVPAPVVAGIAGLIGATDARRVDLT